MVAVQMMFFMWLSIVSNARGITGLQYRNQAARCSVLSCFDMSCVRACSCVNA